tara:strand:+ start:532 stop:717 length:186 start_codon:yes stop_codon:yes gene_type:complete
MNLDKIISIIRSLNEEGVVGAPTNNASSSNIAGLPPDQPPVKKKKKKYIYGGRGSRKNWMP